MKSFAKTGQKVLNLKENSVEEIMNSDYYREVSNGTSAARRTGVR